MLDRASAVPLHLQMEAILREKLKNGEWGPGQAIPSENEMSRLFGVSRMTVRNVVTRLVLEDYLRPIRESGADTLILGCTHFPLLAPIIGDMLGERVTLIDSGAATAGYIRELLRQTGLENPRTEGGVQRYYISEHTETFARTAELFLGHGITAEYAVAELPLEAEEQA